MTEIREPTEDNAGGANQEGSEPQPGGDLDVSGSAVPPYDDRSTGNEDVAAGVARAMGSDEPLEEPTQPGADGPDETDMSDAPPAGTGESINRRAEDVAKDEGPEPGREAIGEDDQGRPIGVSTPRDMSSINPHDDEGASPSATDREQPQDGTDA